MESEVRSLRQEVSRTQDSLRAATRRCRELVRELEGVNAVQERDRLLRDQQLSRILRALLVLESRLKQEQKSIRQLLCEKDNVIRNQQLEIARLRRYTKSYIQGKPCASEEPPSLLSSDFQDHESGLSKDIQKLKCEIMTKLKEGLEEGEAGEAGHPSSQIRKTHSFAGSDISKASLTSSENTDASIITTTTDGSPSLLSTEGFCEGESTDVSPGSTLNKSSNRCTPSIVTTDSETEVTMVVLEGHGKKPASSLPRSESKDDGMDCNYASGEDEDEEEPIYENCEENNARNLQSGRLGPLSGTEDRSNNNVPVALNRLTRIEAEEPAHDDSSGNWYSDPDEDRLNDEMLRHSVYRPNSNHNSVLECVNQILLRDMEDEESVLSVPRRFKHRGKIVRFQPARLSDIESVGSEMERRNSDEPPARPAPCPPYTLALESLDNERQDGNDNEIEPSIDGFEATNSEDEFGMRIVPALDPESGLEEDVEESKARPIVIIEPCVKPDEQMNNSNILRSMGQPASPASLRTERIEDKACLQMSSNNLAIAKNLDYEDIESLPEIIAPPPKIPPALPPKPQFRNNTLILKKIPSPSFLIDETSRKKQVGAEVTPESACRGRVFGLASNQLAAASSTARSLKFDDSPKPKRTPADEATSNFWRNRFNNVRSSFQLRQSEVPEPRKVTNMVRHFEEFKIEGHPEPGPLAVDQQQLSQQQAQQQQQHQSPKKAEFELDEYDIQQNFEEFNLDECDLSDDPDRPEGDGSETFSQAAVQAPVAVLDETGVEHENPLQSKGNGQLVGTGHYDNFLEATGLSNKSILTPSRLLSNHKSMLKPKDVKYKSKIKATAVMERHGVNLAPTTTHTKHWTGPFV